MHFFKFKIRWTLIDLNQIFPMKPLEFEISLSIISFDKKNCRKLLTFLGCRKAPNYQRYRSQISVAQFYDFNQKISKCLRPYLQNFQKYQQLKKTGSGWFILSPMCHCRRGFPLLRLQQHNLNQQSLKALCINDAQSSFKTNKKVPTKPMIV